tara:strand:+ start:732 stop:887 length:156 start_codon:yes stop_codon:yes gene_type:complete
MKSQTTGDYIENNADDGTFILPDEQAFVLTNESSPVYMGGGALVFLSFLRG